MNSSNYFTTKYDVENRYLFFAAQLLFSIGSLVNYYFIKIDNVNMKGLILSFIEFLGALCMAIFQYRAKWLRGTIIMCVALFVSAFVFLDFLFIYLRKHNVMHI